MRCTPISLKITYALMHGGQMQSHSKTGVLSDYYLTFITKDDFIPVCINSPVEITSAPDNTIFFWFTAQILIAFFTVHFCYPSSCNFLSIVRFEKLRFLPLFNKSVISSNFKGFHAMSSCSPGKYPHISIL